ncbi:MAG: c-type cytochrome, partial [Flavobacteriales bacterium]|nr:c-type cytochrome [Flavobacteriales bacterium]
YRTLFNLVFGQNADAFTLTRSIAAFERTIISGNAKFDQYDINSETNSYSSSEQRGWSLFSGSANCIACHEGFNFTNDLFINNGLYDSYPIDSGRARITLKQEDIGKFKVPTLRNVEVTGPYMFDGSIETLEQVIEHYNSGGSNHPNKDPRIKALNLTVQEKEDLVNFLKTLTDEAFLTNPEFQP